MRKSNVGECSSRGLMIPDPRFTRSEVDGCTVETAELWDLEDVLTALTIRGSGEVANLKEGTERARALLEQFEEGTGLDVDAIKVDLLLAQVKIGQSWSLDPETRETVMDALDDALRKTRVQVCLEFSDCLLGSERLRQARAASPASRAARP